MAQCDVVLNDCWNIILKFLHRRRITGYLCSNTVTDSAINSTVTLSVYTYIVF